MIDIKIEFWGNQGISAGHHQTSPHFMDTYLLEDITEFSLTPSPFDTVVQLPSNIPNLNITDAELMLSAEFNKHPYH